MTNQHPIVPSPEQVDQWFDDAVRLNSTPKYYIARQAALWSADQELEVTLGLMETLNIRGVDYIRNARRPKPPSLKEQALAALRDSPVDPVDETLQLSADAELIIRRALGSLSK
jgi:hypothetical protein